MNQQTIQRNVQLATQRQQALGRLRRQFEEAERARIAAEQRAADLQARVDHLERVRAELDDFACIAAHDLKEPLRGISDYCQILLEDYADRLDADGRRRLEALVTMCGRLGTSIDDLLAYCRLGRVRPDADPIDLHAVLGDVLETLGPAIGGKMNAEAASLQLMR